MEENVSNAGIIGIIMGLKFGKESKEELDEALEHLKEVCPDLIDDEFIDFWYKPLDTETIPKIIRSLAKKLNVECL